MSATLPQAAPATTADAKATIRSDLIRVAQDTPALIAAAQTADPDLAAALTGQAAITSRALYGPIITAILTWLVARYGFDLDAATVNAISGLFAVLVGMLFRVLATAPITGVFTKAPVIPSKGTAP